MIIRGKGNSVEFVPENDLECYQLGFMFRDTPHELSIKEKIRNFKVKIWRLL